MKHEATFLLRPLFSAMIASTAISLNAHDGLHDWEGARPDAHAPITVMGDHTHYEGEFMLSYRYMYMDMDGMQSGSDDVSSSDVFAANYTVTPESMSMEMHMFGLMYAPSDTLTLMVMAPYTSLEMEHRIFSGAAPLIALNNNNDTFTTKTEGFGDLKVGGLYNVFDHDGRRAHFGLSISLPTGSIGEQDKVPGPGGLLDRQLPAPMQLGSGTVDFLPSFTYFVQEENWSYGTKLGATLRTGKNHHNYRLGNEFKSELWAARNLNSSLSVSIKMDYKYQEALEGTQSDLTLNPPFAPTRRSVTTAFSENYGGHTLDLGVGANFLFQSGRLEGNRIAFEISAPVYQDLNGYQLQTDFTFTGGWQFAW